jgi:hypothetical protein
MIDEFKALHYCASISSSLAAILGIVGISH